MKDFIIRLLEILTFIWFALIVYAFVNGAKILGISMFDFNVFFRWDLKKVTLGRLSEKQSNTGGGS